MKERRKFKKYLTKFRMAFKDRRKVLSVIISIILAVLLFPVVLNLWISQSYSDHIYQEVEEAPDGEVAVVFGAGLWGGRPSPVLEERVMRAVELYDEGKVNRIIMTGDRNPDGHNEPKAMIEMAKEKGVPEVVMTPDYSGETTYESCYRLKHVFKVDSATLVTQDFHMKRALYTCDSLGVDSIGVLAESPADGEFYFFRDYLALVKAVWEVKVSHPDDVDLTAGEGL